MTSAAAKANPRWLTFNLSQCLERLPSEAKRKYRSLRAGIEDAEALMRTAFEREKVLEATLRALEDRSVDPRDSAAVAEHRAEIAELAAELEQLNRVRGSRHSVLNNLQQVVSQLDIAIPPLVELRRPFRAVTMPPPSNDEPLDRAILRIRGEISRIKAELQIIGAATLPAAEIKAQIIAEIDKLAGEGCPRLDLRNGKVKIRWSDDPEFGDAHTALSAPVLSATKLIAWMFHDLLVEAVTDGIDDQLGDSGLTLAERTARQEALSAQLELVEREEETLIEHALAQGLEVHRRADANVLAVLGIEFVSYDADDDDGDQMEDADPDAVA